MATEMTGAAGPGRGVRMSRLREREGGAAAAAGEDMETVSRSLGMTAAGLSGRRDTFLAAGEASLARRPTGGKVLGSERPNARLGGVLLEREVLEAKNAALEVRGPGPPARRGPRA